MTRPDLFVYVALVVGWVMIGAWILRIGAKADRVQAMLEEAADPD